eukprot:COSAG06_NODE_745_length_12649_cov_128.650916_7_plen_49_part_00
MESVFAGGMESDSDTEAAEAMAVRTPFQLSLRYSFLSGFPMFVPSLSW